VGKPENEATAKESGSYFTMFLNRIGAVFLAPDATFSQIVSGKIGFWEPLALILLLIGIEGAVLASFAVRVISAVTNAIGPVTGITSVSFLAFVPSVLITVMIIGFLLVWIIVAGIAHLIARYVFRGRGSYVQLLKLYGYALVPYSLVILGTVIIGINWATWPFAIFLNVVATFWIVLLMSVAVKHNYGIDVGKAFISSFIGPMLAWLIVIGIFWLWLLVAIGSFAGGFV
jgi:hypothetical protein